MNKTPDARALHASSSVLDGHDDRLLQWISDSKIVAIASDNFAVEDARVSLPSDYHGPRLPLHHH